MTEKHKQKISKNILFLTSDKLPSENSPQKYKNDLSYYITNIQAIISKSIANNSTAVFEKINYYFRRINILFDKLLKEISLFPQYESKNRFDEKVIRKLYSDLFKKQNMNEYLENKITKLVQKQIEFEKVKEKMGIVFSDGQIIHNERKENEILILRSENSNLKNYIQDHEKTLKSKEEEINKLNQTIANLNKEIQKDKKNNTGINRLKSPHVGHSFSNININFNEIKGNNSSRIMEKRDNSQKFGSLFQTFSEKLNPDIISTQKFFNIRNQNKKNDNTQFKKIYNKINPLRKNNQISTRLLKRKQYLNKKNLNAQNKFDNNDFFPNTSRGNEGIYSVCNFTKSNIKNEGSALTNRSNKRANIILDSKYLQFKKDGDSCRKINNVFHKKNNSCTFQLSFNNNIIKTAEKK